MWAGRIPVYLHMQIWDIVITEIKGFSLYLFIYFTQQQRTATCFILKILKDDVFNNILARETRTLFNVYDLKFRIKQEQRAYVFSFCYHSF